VFIAAASTFLRFRLEEKRTFDDNRFARLQPGHDLDVISQIASTSNRSHLEFLRTLRDECEPLFADSLESRGRDHQDRCGFTCDFESSVRRHPRPEHPVRVGQFDANRHGA
jgi:hypothetical protein